MKVFLIFLLAFSVECTREGDSCTKDGVAAVCTNIRRCPEALQDIKIRKPPQLCVFGVEPVVCCVSPTDNVTTTVPPLVTTPSTPPSSTTEDEPFYDDFDNSGSSDQCPPIPPSHTAAPNGQVAWNMCLKYQEKLVFPCVQIPALGPKPTRVNRCHHLEDELIVKPQAERNEFPFMVLLGYESKPARVWWLCSGALISDRFVLTAAHCVSVAGVGKVKYVQLGALQLSAMSPRSRYRVQSVVLHPEYEPPLSNHDIALVQLQTPVRMDEFTVPACLQTGAEADGEGALAAGWGLLARFANTSDTLQKKWVKKFTSEECGGEYLPSRFGWDGFDEGTQLCYGHTDPAHSCQYDGGSPLVKKSNKMLCMYTIVGVAVNPNGCVPTRPGLYSRVAHYRAWIEKTVWPQLATGS